MPNETKTKARSAKAAKKESVQEEVIYQTVEEINEEPGKAKPVVKQVDLSELIPVRNGYQGRLVYKSTRTHEKFVWPEFGDEQMVELLELRNAKNTWKKYFINNWFMFDEEYAWVTDYLGLGQYYKYAIQIDSFDDLFEKTPQEIEDVVSKLSSGQKKSVGYRARQLIAEDGIDSNKAIAALEKALGIELVER